MFNDEEILKIKLLCQNITMRPLPLDKQESVRDGNHVWCADWWTIEVCKFLFHGEQTYLLDPPPNRLKNNPCWNMKTIVNCGTFKLIMYEELKKNLGFADTVLICEVGRGLDIIIADLLKKWKKIICYDLNPNEIDEVNFYFKEKLGLPIESSVMNSSLLKPEEITEKTILLGNQVRLGSEQLEKIKANPNILAIIDGRILDGRA